MAQMFPKTLPPSILDDPKRKGEIDTFDALSKLSDEHIIFYDRCVRAGSSVSAYERPIDFIVLHEKAGMLAIEVKGGKVRVNDRGLIEHYYQKRWNPKDPMEQLKRAVHTLKDNAKADSANYFIPISLCVIFPNTPRANVGGKLPDGMLCEDDLELLPTQLPALFHRTREGPEWAQSSFIDMRRRLQNMPQSNRAAWTEEKKHKKKALKEDVIEKTAPRESERKSTGINLSYMPIGNHGGHYAGARPLPNEYPDSSYVWDSTSEDNEPKLKKREIIIAILTAIVTFCIVSWLFPNSFIHRIF